MAVGYTVDSTITRILMMLEMFPQAKEASRTVSISLVEGKLRFHHPKSRRYATIVPSGASISIALEDMITSTSFRAVRKADDLQAIVDEVMFFYRDIN